MTIHELEPTPVPDARSEEEALRTSRELLSVRDLRVTFGSGERQVNAVNGMSYDMARATRWGSWASRAAARR